MTVAAQPRADALAFTAWLIAAVLVLCGVVALIA